MNMIRGLYKTGVHTTSGDFPTRITYDGHFIMEFDDHRIVLDPQQYYGLQKAVVARRMQQVSDAYSLNIDVYTERGYFFVVQDGATIMFHRTLEVERTS